jgi:hypothetical protein
MEQPPVPSFEQGPHKHTIISLAHITLVVVQNLSLLGSLVSSQDLIIVLHFGDVVLIQNFARKRTVDSIIKLVFIAQNTAPGHEYFFFHSIQLLSRLKIIRF